MSDHVHQRPPAGRIVVPGSRKSSVIALRVLLPCAIAAVLFGCAGRSTAAKAAPGRPAPAVFHVSTSGSDSWSGTICKPNSGGTDGPFATLERARDAIRALKAGVAPLAGGAIVWIHDGDYFRKDTFELVAEDSGAAGALIVYRAWPGDTPRILGGHRVKTWNKVKDAGVRSRLAESARNFVIETDLASLGIKDFGRFTTRGFSRPTTPAHLELFFNGKPMQPARWPNGTYATIAAVPDETAEYGKIEDGFFYSDERGENRPAGWKEPGLAWVYGFWCWDWAASYEAVQSLDTVTRRIMTKAPYGAYGFRPGQHYYFLNVLEELDAPGEYFVDTRRGTLYFYPPSMATLAESIVSETEATLVTLKDVSHVRIEGLTFAATRGAAISITGGEDVLVSGCVLTDIGTNGVEISGGTGHGVSRCEISYTGDCGVKIEGGDRKTLTPCGHFVEDSRIRDFSRWTTTYAPAVLMSGVGIRVSHNHLHRAPHSAIIYSGNDHLIEYNDIHDVLSDTSDCGAIYTGRDYTARGNVIRYNYIHDCASINGSNMGVYIDDCASGQTIYGNYVARIRFGVFVGGGRDVIVENNLVVDCPRPFWQDARGASPEPTWRAMVTGIMRERAEAVDYLKPPYITRYPKLASLEKYFTTGEPIPPEGNRIHRNVAIGGNGIDMADGAPAPWVKTSDNLIVLDEPEGVGGPREATYAKRTRAQVEAAVREAQRRYGFEPIPMESVGIRK